MQKHGKVQMTLFNYRTFGTTWNTFRTNLEQIKASKVPLSKMSKKMEQWNKVIYIIDNHLFMMFQNCSKPVPNVPEF